MKKVIAFILTAAFAAIVFAGSVNADEPYTAFDYDWWWDTYPVQNGYMVDRVVNGFDLGLTAGLKDPSDLFLYRKTGDIYIVDAGNNRIVVCDNNFGNTRTLDSFTYAGDYRLDQSKIGTTTTLKNPQGIFITEFKGETRVYIADHDNNRVLACRIKKDGQWEIWMEYTRPSSDLYDANVTFEPKKVVADSAGNVYVCIKSITQGSVQFAEDGSFNGYYGANRVEASFNAALNKLLKYILTREQMEKRVRPVPVEFANFTIDNDGFIYTVTDAKSASMDVLKKLDPAGRNVFQQQGYDDMIWGAVNQPYLNFKQYKSAIVDVSVDEDNSIYLMDRVSGKVFRYDYEGELLFIFGGIGNQKGLFTAPSAIDTYKGKVYILDNSKCSLTVYTLTEFGALVNEAMDLFNRGRYIESRGPWEEILRRDANYYMAYIGMGNALLANYEYGEALKYFYKHSISGYNRAFKDYRINYMRQNFNRIMLILFVIIAGIIAARTLIRRGRRSKTIKAKEAVNDGV